LSGLGKNSLERDAIPRQEFSNPFWLVLRVKAGSQSICCEES